MAYMGFKVNTKELRNLAWWVGRANTIINDPTLLTGAVRVLGEGINSNFSGQSGPDGPWRALSNTTRRVREMRGYNGQRPVLQQSGGLRKAAVDPMRTWGEDTLSRTLTTPASYENSSETRFLGVITSRNFVGTLYGFKVQNQYGGTPMSAASIDPFALGGGELGVAPARPFWYITQEVADKMAAPVLDKFERKWAMASGGLAKSSGVRG